MLSTDKDTYQIILCSRTSSNTGIANLNNITYYCNWPAMLPISQYTKYECSFVFKSENYDGPGHNGLLTNNGLISVDVGRTQIFDGTSQSFNLGMIYPVILNNTAAAQLSFYNSTNNDNNPVILYPTQNMVTVKLNTFAGVAMANMQHYCLILNLTPCI